MSGGSHCSRSLRRRTSIRREFDSFGIEVDETYRALWNDAGENAAVSLDGQGGTDAPVAAVAGAAERSDAEIDAEIEERIKREDDRFYDDLDALEQGTRGARERFDFAADFWFEKWSATEAKVTIELGGGMDYNCWSIAVMPVGTLTDGK